MDIYILQYNYESKYLVIIIDANLYVFKNDKYNFYPPFLSFQAKNISIGKSKVCPMTEFSSGVDRVDFDGNTHLLECENKEKIYNSRLQILKIKTDDKRVTYL